VAAVGGAFEHGREGAVRQSKRQAREIVRELGRLRRYKACMRLALKRHPDSRSTAETGVEVEVARRGGRLELTYFVTGAVQRLRLPGPAASERADELWKHTCLEAFVRAGQGDGYCEFNFSPSTRWAAYRFSGYRDGMADIGEVDAPLIEAHAGEGAYELHVALDLSRLPEVAPDAVWKLGLTAIVEDVDGGKSWWALEHAPDKPDFHHPVSFAFELPAADRP
jgi:hypothetical protein